MIEIKDDWGASKMIVPSNLDNLKKVVDSLSISKKPECVIITPIKILFWDKRRALLNKNL